MNKSIAWVIAIVVVLGGVGYYYYQYVPEPEPPPPPVVIQPAPAPAPEPVFEEPITRPQVPTAPEPEPEPLPSLADSDAVIAATIAGLTGSPAFDQLFNVQAIVQHIVTTVDNLPRRKVSQKIIPVKPASGKFGVEGDQASLKISADNYRRYAPYLALIEAVDIDQLVDSYRRYYPLFDEAYTELGYPDGGFDERLISVLDHLLATPDVADPVYLIKPEAFYQYEDPDLEALSAGQKALIRMGADNALAVKSTLRSFQAALLL